MNELVNMMREYAQDNYWHSSWDIVADRWNDTQIACVITGAKTRRGAIAKTWGVLQLIDRKRSNRSRPVKPICLVEFLASIGGLRDDDKLIADVRYSVGKNLMVPGFGPLIRQQHTLSTAARAGGRRAPLFLDTAREACVEAGYLQDEDCTIADLLDLIADEARGRKHYAQGEEHHALNFAENRELQERAQESADACPF